MDMKMTTKRTRLSLKEKVDVIIVREKEKLSVRDLAKKFNVGKTCIAETLKNKNEILERFENHGNINSKKDFRTEGGLAIDKAMYDWLCRALSCNAPISGTLIRDKALEVARNLGNTKFKASAGWLDRFKARHGIKFKTLCREEPPVDWSLNDWDTNLKDLCAGFSSRDIYNCDETALFFKALPDETMSLQGKTCESGRLSGERLTILLCTNMAGEFETPLIIGKENPICLDNVDLNLFSVDWRGNDKSWMTLEIMTEWLISFNNKISRQRRNIILFMDYAESHPPIELSNIKIVFFPPNTTCQPLEQGIIYNFKFNYRKCLMRYVLAHIEESVNPSELSRKINVLNAIQWVRTSIKNIKKETVVHCFVKSGFPSLLSEIYNNSPENTDPEIVSLMEALQFSNVSCESYVTIDINTLTELPLKIEDTPNLNSELKVEESDEEETKYNLAEVGQVITNKEALSQLQSLLHYYIANNDSEGVNSISKLQENLEKKLAEEKKC
ncbi:tigger transposable element-derived protein 6-like [Halyomorpha halys]|uniref:tigger transposable element-derived protein 6-like n=1 Tax=Halyomorpha halys TaxID=286706 RepID=UPI0034D3853E